ncbi:MAG: acyl carrier protein [Burkholderiaceae bacterium]
MMNKQELQAVVFSTLKSIAPEVEENDLVPSQPLRNQVDLDSMDWLNFLVGLHQKLNVEIPESDYSRLRTLDDLTEYMGRKIGI